MITPFRYTRMIFSIFLGIFIFGEILSTAMIVGSLVIVISGLFIIMAGNRAK